MNLADVRTLLDYHYWARDRVLEAVEPLAPEQWTRDMGSSFRSIHETLVHVYSAEWAWHSRWTGHSPTAHIAASDYPDVTALRRAWSEQESKVRQFVEGLGDEGLTRVCEYKLLNGTPGRSPFWQMLQHMVNHASYHRGQVTTMLRQLGAKPGKSMDMIAFFRSL
jgi:uncharacterized damage-inducible protein DinB